MKKEKNIYKVSGIESKKEIKIDVMGMDELLVWSLGDRENNYMPCIDDLKEFQDFIMETTKQLPAHVFVPDFVSVKKIKVKPNTKHIIITEGVNITQKEK